MSHRNGMQMAARRHLERIGDDARKTASDVGVAVADIGQQVSTRAGKAGRAAYRKAVGTVRQADSSLRHSIRENPLQAVGIGAAIGLVMGLWLRRRR